MTSDICKTFLAIHLGYHIQIHLHYCCSPPTSTVDFGGANTSITSILVSLFMFLEEATAAFPWQEKLVLPLIATPDVAVQF